MQPRITFKIIYLAHAKFHTTFIFIFSFLKCSCNTFMLSLFVLEFTTFLESSYFSFNNQPEGPQWMLLLPLLHMCQPPNKYTAAPSPSLRCPTNLGLPVSIRVGVFHSQLFIMKTFKYSAKLKEHFTINIHIPTNRLNHC